MTTLRRFACALAITLFALAPTARAQTPEPEAEAPAPQESLAPTGSGTAGKIPKWTTSTNLGNSVITESAGKVGVNIAAPAARLHVFGATPAPLATNGTAATHLLVTTGGQGGNTTGTTGQRGGGGANIILLAGHGGSAPAGSTNGKGGSITLQPGFAGGGAGLSAPHGNVLLAPSGVGKVGIGTGAPTARLHVEAGNGTGVYSRSTTGFGVFAISTELDGVYGYSRSGNGVYGESLHGNAGYFYGNARVTGTLFVGSCGGCTIAPSDRALKANLSAIDPRSVLDKLAALPIQTWNYKSDSPSVRHVGPMAQDFRAAFNLGADDKHIDMIDASGVTMASVQALYQLMKERDEQVQRMMQQKDRQIEALARKVEQQGRHNEQLQAQLDQVRRAVRGRRAARR